MIEQAPKRSSKPHWRESPHLSFAAQTVKIQGDPETAADFNRAFSYLEAITAHFVEYGPLEAREAWEVSYELSHHNAWHQWEVEQERKRGEPTAEYREISLGQLYALSKRRLLAKSDAGKVDEASAFVDQLIAQAVADEEALERLITPAPNELNSSQVETNSFS